MLEQLHALEWGFAFVLAELGVQRSAAGEEGALFGERAVEAALGLFDGVEEEGAFQAFKAAELPQVLDEAVDEADFDGAGGAQVGEVVGQGGAVVGGVLDSAMAMRP